MTFVTEVLLLAFTVPLMVALVLEIAVAAVVVTLGASRTVMALLTLAIPVALAVTLTVAFPLATGAVSVNCAEVDPAGMVIGDDTVRRDGVSVVRVTVRAAVNVPLSVTVPVPATPSVTVGGSESDMLRSASVDHHGRVPSVQLVTCAVMMAVWSPLTK